METGSSDMVKWERIKAGLLCCILLVLVAFTAGVYSLLHDLRSYEDTVQSILTRVDVMTGQLEELDVEGMVAAANEVTRTLEETDLAGIAENVDALVLRARDSLVTAEETLAQAGEKLDALDVDALNQAIEDLKKAIEPLAVFVGRFK